MDDHATEGRGAGASKPDAPSAPPTRRTEQLIANAAEALRQLEDACALDADLVPSPVEVTEAKRLSKQAEGIAAKLGSLRMAPPAEPKAEAEAEAEAEAVPQEDEQRTAAADKEAARDQLKHMVGGVFVVAVAMGLAAFMANWLGQIWFDWVVSPWSRRELPMLFITVTLHAVLRLSEHEHTDAKEEESVLVVDSAARAGGADATQDTGSSTSEDRIASDQRGDVAAVETGPASSPTAHEGEGEGEEGGAAPSEQAQTVPTDRVLFSDAHMKHLREKLFETFFVYRLIVGFPLWHVAVRVLTFVTVTRYNCKEHFGFRISLLLAIYAAFRFRRTILHGMLPVFAVFYAWLIGGQFLADVATFPVDIVWRLVDWAVVGTTGASFVRGVVIRKLVVGAASLGVDLFWMLPLPVCYDEYYEAYREALPEELPADLELTRGFLAPTTGSCASECAAELVHMLLSRRGVMKSVLFVLLVQALRRVNAFGMLRRWLQERESSLDEFERVLANRNRVLEYAKSNPFRAKLHADPRRFLEEHKEDEGASSSSPSAAAASVTSPVASLTSSWKIKDLGIKSSLKKLRDQWQQPAASLHLRVGQRAKSSTSVERIEGLRESLRALHGVPDTFDIIFRKVKMPLRRGLDAQGRCVFFQVSESLLSYSMKHLRNGVCVTFEDESGVDGGGLTAEMFQLVAEELVANVGEETAKPTPSQNGDDHDGDEDTDAGSEASAGATGCSGCAETPCACTRNEYARPRLLRALPDSTLMLAPNPTLELVHYYALGRLIGIALLHENSFQLPLSSAMLKMMLDGEIHAEDVRALDPTYFENRMLTLLQPGGVEIMKSIMDIPDIPFVWIDSNGTFGQELCPDGAQRMLSEQNKLEYVQLLSEHYVCGGVREQMQIFLSGFHEVIPVNLMRMHEVDYVDLALALHGASEIDVDDWQQHSIEPNVKRSWTLREGGVDSVVRTEDMVAWFWEAVRAMGPEQRARLLQFCTGLSSAPVGGFRNLKPRRFNMVIDEDPHHYPSAQTCFATLRLPLCVSQAKLADKLDQVCSQRHLTETFGES